MSKQNPEGKLTTLTASHAHTLEGYTASGSAAPPSERHVYAEIDEQMVSVWPPLI